MTDALDWHELDLETSLAFINTLEHSDAGDRDDLPTLAASLDWLVEHRALRAEERSGLSDPDRSEERLRKVLSLRAALREIVDAAVAGRPPSPDAVARANGALAAAPVPQLAITADGVTLAHRKGPDALDDALWALVDPIAEALADGRPDRLRVCANDSCRWVFYDTSPTGRRRWCDMSTCGNRAKARRHRARQRVDRS